MIHVVDPTSSPSGIKFLLVLTKGALFYIGVDFGVGTVCAVSWKKEKGSSFDPIFLHY